MFYRVHEAAVLSGVGDEGADLEIGLDGVDFGQNDFFFFALGSELAS